MKRFVLLLVCLMLMAFAANSASAELLVQNQSFGDMVLRVQLRLRELGYFHFKPTGSFHAMTMTAVKAYQSTQVKADGSAMIADGTVGEETMDLLFQPGAARNAIVQSIPFGSTAKTADNAPGKLTTWCDVREQLRVGATYTITDYYSGQTFQVQFTGGEEHAEVECASSPDTDVYKSLFGGQFNYSKRPVLVSVGGVFVAASLQGQPHGEDTVPNNGMAGHACLFFEGSRSHVGALPDAEHARQIAIAAGRA